MVYFLQCTPPDGLQTAAAEFDTLLFSELQALLGSVASCWGTVQRTLAGLPLSAGGLGLTPASHVLLYAWLSSYTDTLPLQQAVLPPDTP